MKYSYSYSIGDIMDIAVGSYDVFDHHSYWYMLVALEDG